MSDDRIIWLEASLEAHSHRRMYALALDICGSDAASPELRKAARRVVRSLEGVIELPIADAKVLAKASRKFAKLAAMIQEITVKEPPIAA
jgi:hypothetical protein